MNYNTPPWDEPQFKCEECEKPIYEEGYCSFECKTLH